MPHIHIYASKRLYQVVQVHYEALKNGASRKSA